MTAKNLRDEPLIGRFVRLDPLTEGDLGELFTAIGVPEVFEHGYGGGPAGLKETPEAFAEWARGYYPWRRDGITWAVRERESGALVGTSTLAEAHLVRESIHLGWTAYAPRVWGTAVNPETKLLLLGLAFESGFGRVKIQADAINVRSRAAIARLGAQFEGIVRRDMPRADGSWRDSAVYSIVAEEWPAVRGALTARIDGYAHR